MPRLEATRSADSRTFTLTPGWRIVVKDLGGRPGGVLRRAGLPAALLHSDSTALSIEEYVRFWLAIEDEVGDALLPLRVGRAISVEAFDPPVFAALCSPDLNVALARIARFNQLIAPIRLHVETSNEQTTLRFEWPDSTVAQPPGMIATELVYFVQLARLATRVEVRPLAITAPVPLEPRAAYTDYFGRPVRRGPAASIVFSAEDAARPFVTVHHAMWQFFEPSLLERLSALGESASAAERVRAALVELLPGGPASMSRVGKALGIGSRTLQRRLGAEGTTFQVVLDRTREQLARHYLGRSSMALAEIAFLLGFEDPNSFFRAFRRWTGQTPEQVRATSLSARDA